jgi:hypothetical protein
MRYKPRDITARIQQTIAGTSRVEYEPMNTKLLANPIFRD